MERVISADFIQKSTYFTKALGRRTTIKIYYDSRRKKGGGLLSTPHTSSNISDTLHSTHFQCESLSSVLPPPPSEPSPVFSNH